MSSGKLIVYAGCSLQYPTSIRPLADAKYDCLGADTRECSCSTACRKQKRKICQDGCRLHEGDCGGGLTDIMQHRSEDAANPDVLSVDHLTQQEHTQEAEHPSAKAVDER